MIRKTITVTMLAFILLVTAYAIVGVAGGSIGNGSANPETLKVYMGR